MLWWRERILWVSFNLFSCIEPILFTLELSLCKWHRQILVFVVTFHGRYVPIALRRWVIQNAHYSTWHLWIWPELFTFLFFLPLCGGYLLHQSLRWSLFEDVAKLVIVLERLLSYVPSFRAKWHLSFPFHVATRVYLIHRVMLVFCHLNSFNLFLKWVNQ